MLSVSKTLFPSSRITFCTVGHNDDCRSYEYRIELPSRVGTGANPVRVSKSIQYIKVDSFAYSLIRFIGAPIATSISDTLMSIMYIFYAVFRAPHTAWHPVSSKSFASLPKLFTMGLVGVGQSAAEWWSWEFVSLAASQ